MDTDKQDSAAMGERIQHDDPRELTRRECKDVLDIAAQFGYVDPVEAQL